MTKSKFNLPRGTKLVAKQDFISEFSYGTKSRLTKGKIYEVSHYSSCGLFVECDMKVGPVCWGGANIGDTEFRLDELFEIYEEAADLTALVEEAKRTKAIWLQAKAALEKALANAI